MLAGMMVAVAIFGARPAATALAQGDQRIAAIVNDEVISIQDVEDRLDLLLATSNLDDSAESRSRLRPEVLRILVDDALKRQEARRLDIKVVRADIDRAIAQIEEQSKLSPGQLAEVLRQRGVSMASLVDQLEADLAWIRVVNRLARDRLEIAAEDIDAEIGRLQQSTGQPEFRVAEIFLPVDDPREEDDVAELATRLVNDIRGGASFAALARNFSQGATAAAGGDLGWIRRGQIDDPLDAALPQLAPGQVSPPIRTSLGYHLLLLVDRRTTPGFAARSASVSLHQLVLALPPTASPTEVTTQLQRARELSAGVQDCSEFAARAQRGASSLSGSLGRVDVNQLPGPIRQVIAPLQAGQVSPPIRSPDGIVVIMVCERNEAEVGPEERAMIERSLRDQRLQSAARGFLRDLRRSAFVDLRI